MIDPLRIDLVPLAILGGIGTYAARALPLLAPGVDRLRRQCSPTCASLAPRTRRDCRADIFVADGAFRVGPEAVAVITGRQSVGGAAASWWGWRYRWWWCSFCALRSRHD